MRSHHCERAYAYWFSQSSHTCIGYPTPGIVKRYMCLKMSEEAQLIAPKPTRSPLNTQTNAQTNAISLISNKDGKKVRRKSSFVRRLDSSESVPSSHDSIFIAEYLSPYNSEESGYKLETWDKSDQQIPLSPSLELPTLPSPPSENDENGNQRLSIGITPILYGHGTPLTTIIEQKSSNPTLRESTSSTSAIRPLARPRSASDLTTSTTSFHSRPTHVGAALGGSPLRNLQFSTSGIIRRLESLSADASVESIKLSWPAGYDPQRASWRGKSSLDSESAPTSPINEIYAQPLRPMQPPVERPGTPDGMPSWTAAQQRQPPIANAQGETRRGWVIHEASSMLHRLFSNRSQPGAASSTQDETQEPATTTSGYGIRGPWDSIPSHRRTVSAPVLRGAPRFRPPRSAHGVARLEMHPFASAGGLQVSSKSDTADVGVAPATAVSTTTRRGSYSNAVARPAPSATPDGNGGEVAAGTQHRQVSLRAKGKRKPGQRVRFTPSTADPGTTSQREFGTFTGPDVKVCPHKRATNGGVQLWDASAAPLVGAHDAAVSVPASTSVAMAHDSLLLSTNRTPVTDCQTLPLSGVDGTRSPLNAAQRGGFTARTHCWKCRFENAAEKMDRVWDATARWCCWYCCGIDMDEVKEVSIGGPDVGVRVRSFEQVRA